MEHQTAERVKEILSSGTSELDRSVGLVLSRCDADWANIYRRAKLSNISL